MSTGHSLASALLCVSIALAPLLACGTVPKRINAGATQPQSPADGAGDDQIHPNENLGKEAVSAAPTTGPEAPQATSSAAAAQPDCPPRCADGGWIGCGLKKPRGTACTGCTPKCKRKGTVDEGWYDCAGVLIVQSSCASAP